MDHQTLEVAAAALGLLGTWLLRKPSRWAPWGFVAWLFSNPAAMALMYVQGNWWLLAQFTIYWLIAMASVWHWLIKPRLQRART